MFHLHVIACFLPGTSLLICGLCNSTGPFYWFVGGLKNGELLTDRRSFLQLIVFEGQLSMAADNFGAQQSYGGLK